MESGSITSNIDVAQVVLYAFWIFFAGLIIYIRREDKREGYPLDSSRTERSGGRVKVQGFPATPGPKTFRLLHGGAVHAPGAKREEHPIHAESTGNGMGSPLEPVGNPMLAAIGPGAYSLRAQEPDLTFDGKPRIVPLRAVPGHGLDSRDPNPIGMPVVDAKGNVAGKVTEAWIDLSEPHVRYLEAAIPAGDGDANPRSVLIPIGFLKISRVRGVVVRSITADQFADAPTRANADQVTLREEDQTCAYYGGGTMYATPKRREPIV